MTLFIHIGFPKCASTYLQEGVFPNHPDIEYLGKRNPIGERSTLDKLKGAIFPSYKYVGKRNDPSLKSTSNRVERIERLQSPDWISNIYLKPPLYWQPDYTKERYQKIKSSTHKDILCFSDEGLIGDPIHNPQFTYRSARRLHNLWPDAKIIIVLRNQLSMIESVYKMYIAQGGYCKLSTLIEFSDNYFPEPRPSIYMPHFKYDKLLTLYHQLFGSDNILVLLLEDLKRNQETFLNKIYHFMGIKEIEITLEKTNVGPQLNSFLKLKRFLNSLMTTRHHPDQLLPYLPLGLITLGNLFGENKDASEKERFENFFGTGLTREITYYYRQSNANLEKIMDRELTKLGYFSTEENG